MPNDGFGNNEDIDVLDDDIVDFSENNPVNEITEFNGGEMKDIVVSDDGDIITVGSGEVWVNGESFQIIENDFVVYPNSVTISE